MPLELGHGGRSQIERGAVFEFGCLTSLETLEHPLQFGAGIDAQDRRRRLVRPESMVIAGAGHGRSKQIGMQIQSTNNGTDEGQELEVTCATVVRVEEIVTCIGHQRPVVVLAASIDAGEGLLMKQTYHPMFTGGSTQDTHGLHLVIACQVGPLEERRQLELMWCHLVVTGLGGNAQRVQSSLDVRHVGLDLGWNGAEVMVVELVSLRCVGTDERSTAHSQIRTHLYSSSSSRKYSCSQPSVV